VTPDASQTPATETPSAEAPADKTSLLDDSAVAPADNASAKVEPPKPIEE
jgi:hypothetical protein